ncbi:beta-lactamase/transpeptidase-like protein [Rickenella mellea]|uniref:Beta-lactamase/transpeptidase-like protein n=1 Tax=Rickenella mellea TaxID=50990 RepID=A0A4Y7PRV6_9AGAM|nr:beta-lactamase/transpeptidase-like protein [Rickenella mellea]
MVSAKFLIALIVGLIPGHRLGTNDLHESIGTKIFEQKDAVVNGDLSTYVQLLMGYYNVKGLALAVVRPDGEVEFGSWGNRTETGDKVTPDTLFNIGSCSKAFMSASLGILMDDFASGRNTTPLPHELTEFGWQTELREILPADWKLEDTWASEKANIQDILTHLSGLPRHDLSYSRTDSAKDAVRRLRYLKPTFELRQQWQYNNQMYGAGSHIVSTYTGSYAKFVKNRIFSALGMNSTTFFSSEAESTGRFSQSWSVDGRRIPYPLPDESIDLIAGAGGVITSASDITQWLKMLLRDGQHPSSNTTVVPKAGFDAVTTAHSFITGGGVGTTSFSIQGYGMGWIRFSYQGHEIVYHNGGTPGISSSIAFLPNNNLGLAVFTNGGGKNQVADAVMYRIIGDVLKLQSNANATSNGSSSTPGLQRRQEKKVTTTLPLQQYAGTYSNPGYGSITFCDPRGNSSYCRAVLSNFSTVDSASQSTSPADNSSSLFAATNRLWCTHIRLDAIEPQLPAPNPDVNGDTFGMRTPFLYPEGYGADKTPFADTYGLGDNYIAVAQFVVQHGKVVGFGIFQDIRTTVIGVRKYAEVWFDKI